jgi:hypothetical protein
MVQNIALGTVIVNTPLVRVEKSKQGWSMFINCKDGSVIEHEPFQPNLEGMVAAISLSAEICAGKFYLSKVISTPKEMATIDFKTKGGIK